MTMVRRYAGPVGLALLVACSGATDSCTDCSSMPEVPYPDPAPPGGAIQADAVRVRVTENALEFIRTHIGTLLGGFLTVENGQGIYYLDESLFTPGGPSPDPIFIRDGCIGEPDEPCGGTSTGLSQIAFELDALAEALTLDWLEPDASGNPGIHFALNDFELFVDLVMVTNIDLLGAAACHVYNPPGVAALRLHEMSFDIRIEIDPSGALSTFVDNVTIDLGPADDSTLNLNIAACDGVADPACTDPCCGGTCDAAVPAAVCSDVCNLFDLFAQLGGFLTEVLSPLLDALGPELAGAISDALQEALAGVPLTVQTSLDLEMLTRGLLVGAQPINLAINAGSSIDVAGSGPGRGLQLGLAGGMAAPTAAVCADGAEPPDLAALVGPPPEFGGFVEIFDDTSGSSHFEPYHAVITISEAMLAQLFWGAFRSGALCLHLDAYDVEALAGSSFSLTAGLLMDFDVRLAGLTEPAAPMLLTLWATKEPVLRLGAGGTIGEGIEDPLIELVMDDLLVGISLQMDDTPMRLTSINADLIVSLGAERTPGNELEVVLQGIEIAEMRQLDNEMVPHSDLSGLFRLVIELAVGQLLGDARFKLDAGDALAGLGVPLTLHLNALRRDRGATGANFLSLYATLCDEDEIADENNKTCYKPEPASGKSSTSLAARLYDEGSLYVEADPERFPADRWIAAPSGRALLKVAAGPLGPESYVYQFRVDDGMWSTFRAAPDGLLEASSARLLLLGRHVVEVRARPVGEYRLRSEPVSVAFWVDRERPAIQIWRDSDIVWIETEDRGSGGAVELWMRLADSGTGWRAAERAIDITLLAGTLELVARDLAGNSSRVVAVPLDPVVRPLTADAAPGVAPRSGCAAAPLALAPLLVAPLVWRRRRARRD